jgi:hypothetical protein
VETPPTALLRECRRLVVSMPDTAACMLAGWLLPCPAQPQTLLQQRTRLTHVLSDCVLSTLVLLPAAGTMLRS